MSRRLAIVLSHPIQYYSPWFRWLQAHAAINFRVFYLSDSGVRPTRDPQFGETFAWDVDLLSGYDHEFVPNVSRQPGTDRLMGLRNPTLTARISAWGANAILLFGYYYATHLSLIAWARRRRLPLIFRGDSHLLGRGQPGFVARLCLGLLYRQFQAFLYVGQANREYFRVFGVPEKKLFFAPHCVDADHFQSTGPVRTEAAALRASLGLADRRVILFAGKLVPAKQPMELLTAFLSEPRPGAALVFVGQGELRAALEARAAANPDAMVRFLPFANQSQMPARYLLADLFVLPSRGHYETWGLAVNEAMLLGVPCLVSDRVGCQQDLVTEGETGWVFPADSFEGLRAALGRALAALDSDRTALRDRIARRIGGYSYAVAAQALQAACDSLIPLP